jgi:hypothetical protein
MDYAAITEFILVFLFAATKFAMSLGYMLLPSVDYSYFEIVITLLTGGTTGIVTFYYATGWLNRMINKILPSKKPKKKFTKGNRRFIKIKNKYGLIGISMLTPVLFSIPIGCFLASRFYAGKKTTIPIMLIGIVFWAFVLPLIRLSY